MSAIRSKSYSVTPAAAPSAAVFAMMRLPPRSSAILPSGKAKGWISLSLSSPSSTPSATSKMTAPPGTTSCLWWKMASLLRGSNR
mgnify:CR=1 FL=1